MKRTSPRTRCEPPTMAIAIKTPEDIARMRVAGRLAAEVYGLAIVAADIQDLSGNKTRFMVLARTTGPRSGGEDPNASGPVSDPPPHAARTETSSAPATARRMLLYCKASPAE